jgi:hypothetical protein
LFDRVIAFTGYRDIEFEMYANFSKKFVVMGNDEAALRSLFTEDIIRFFEEHQISHIESNGEALLVFNKLKLARTDETIEFIEYGVELANLFNA